MDVAFSVVLAARVRSILFPKGHRRCVAVFPLLCTRVATVLVDNDPSLFSSSPNRED